MNSHVTQPGCPGIPDDSLACKSLTLDTSELELDGYTVTFTIIADGGASTKATIYLPVTCPDTVQVIKPSPI